MDKGTLSAKGATRKSGKIGEASGSHQLTDRVEEKAMLDIWADLNIYAILSKESNTTDANPEQTSPSFETQAYVLREMPTLVHQLTLDTFCRKIIQDIFLKAESMCGHRVTYVPVWETYSLWIEEQVIAAAKSKSPIKLSALRKRCRARHKQALETQKKRLHELGIFADWDTSQKRLESRQEARLIALISRLRDSGYLYDIPQLSPWCPKCTIPLNETSGIQRPTQALKSFVKFPFNVGLEEFGTNVFFCVQLPYLREIAGTVELGITENTTYWLTQFASEFLLFTEPQLKNFCQHLAKSQRYPRRIKEIKATELTGCTVAHPLFPSKKLDIRLIPERFIKDVPHLQSTDLLKSGVLPLSPAHDQLSYDIAQELKMVSTPIFDETGRLTEEAGHLCGLYLSDVEKPIILQLEKFGYLLKRYNEEQHEPHCPRCGELAVLRPCSQWEFSITENPATVQSLNAQDHWDNYGNTEHKNIVDVRAAVLNFNSLQVSSQRQWGMPLPILLCDQCDKPLADKNTLSAIRNSVQRGFESWFRLSVEELLPANTHCPSCTSSEFRKEATIIDCHFANLLQIVDSSDFKKALGGSTSIMFVPQPSQSDSKWIRWLAEISVISAALTRSRPIKESQPFKQLKLDALPKISSNIEIEEAFLNKYPADVLRLVAMTADLSEQRVTQQRLEEIAEDRLIEYQQLQTFLAHVSFLVRRLREEGKDNREGHTENGDANKTDRFSSPGETREVNRHPQTSDEQQVEQEDIHLAGAPAEPNLETLDMNGLRTTVADQSFTTDLVVTTVTAQFLKEVETAYQHRRFHEMWKMLTTFCKQDLGFYVHLFESGDAAIVDTARDRLPQISIALLQRFAPLTPFLAEHFYRLISSADGSDKQSIFQKSWRSVSPAIRQDMGVSPTKKDDAKAEWEALKNVHNTEV